MIELEVQKFLRSGGTFADLQEKYGIKHRRHEKHPSLVCFKYDQIASPFAEPIVRECRGIILDEANDWAVVSMAFTKFFNHGEGHAAEIDWSTARVQEKVDGSLCVLYHHSGDWHVATTGTPDGSGDVNGYGIRFSELFWDVFRETPLAIPKDTRCCYFFELTTPLNRVVVRHEGRRLTFLGARDLMTLQELAFPYAVAAYDPPTQSLHRIRVKEFALQSFDDIARTFETMSPLSQEGYVVVDGYFNRVKVKHPGYVALHHAKGGLSRKAFVQIVRAGESSEVLVAFPEYAPIANDARERFEALVQELEADYARLKDIAEQKAFALEAVKTKCSSALFCVRSGKAESVRAFLRDTRIENVMTLLGYKERDDEPLATEAA